MANNERLGASFAIDVTNLKAGLTQANRLIKESQSEFQAAAAGMDDWTASEDGLNAKIRSLNQITDLQRKKVDALQSEYDSLIANGLDPTSRQAVELRTKINNETAALNKNEAELKKQTAALEDLTKETKDAGNATEDMGGKFGGLKAAGGVAAGAIAGVAGAAVAAVGAFLSLAESTRESRNEMAKLETSFQTAGLSAESAESTFTSLYGIMGDEGAAVEAAQQLAKISENEKDLEANTRILTGVMAEYGNSIPLEGLAEGIASSAAMSSVQGPLADALEWQGVSLDEYNAKLATLATEEERAAYIQSTLTGLYGESADAYRENNAEVIAAQEAQASLNSIMNELGAIAEPIMTSIKLIATDLLQSIAPFVELIGEGLSGALNGTAGAADKLADGLSGLISTLLEKIVEIIPFLIETIVAIVPKLISAILGQIPAIIQMLFDVVNQIISALSTILPQILAKIIELIPQLITSIISAIPSVLQAAIQLLLSIVQAIPTLITSLVSALPSVIQTIIETLVTAIPLIIQAAIDLLMSIVGAIPVIIVALTESLPKIINSIPLILESAINLLMSIIQAIPTIITALVKNVPQLVISIVATLLSNIPVILNAAIQLLMGIVEAIPKIIIELVKAVPQIITGIVNGLKDGFSSIVTVGKDLISGLWNGMKDLSWIKAKIKGWVGDVMKFIKKLFGINSPSKVMADQVGKNLALGIGVGFEKNIAAVNNDIADAMNFDDPKYPTGKPRNNGGGVGGITQINNFKQATTSQLEKYKAKQQLYAAARLIKTGAV